MTNILTKLNRSFSALITVDVQNDFVLPGALAEMPGAHQMIPKMVELIQAFRRAKKPVIHVVRLYLPDGSNVDLCRREAVRLGKHIVLPETAGAELVAELKPSKSVRLRSELLLQGNVQIIGDREVVVYKPRWGAFYRTVLETFLKEHRVDSLVFCGCNFPNCPRASIYEASERDFKISLATDAVSGLYEEGIRELERIGVSMQTTAEIISWLETATQESEGNNYG